jgi:hypothetical protein
MDMFLLSWCYCAHHEIDAAMRELSMTNDPIEEGFEVFLSNGEKAFGAVRQVSPDGRPELVIYVENAGDFVVPLSAVKAVISQKVILNSGKLDARLRQAIGHAHDSEDPRI